MAHKIIEKQGIRIVLFAGAAAAIVLLMWLTVPGTTKKYIDEAGKTNVNAVTNTAPANGNMNAKAPVKTTPKKVVPKIGPSFTLKKSAHFIASSIANNTVFTTSKPTSVTVTFDTPLKKDGGSTMTVKRDDVYSATVGPSYIGPDGKSLSVNINQAIGSGDYYVYYGVCFVNAPCSDGRFGFRITVPK